MKRTESQLEGFIVDEICMDCSDDILCTEHYEQKESRLINLAYAKVEQNLVEREGDDFLSADVHPSGHDWVASVSRKEDGTIREEFLEPTNNLSDRLQGYVFLGQHIYPLYDGADIKAYVMVPRGYAICHTCHLQYNLAIPCPNH